MFSLLQFVSQMARWKRQLRKRRRRAGTSRRPYAGVNHRVERSKRVALLAKLAFVGVLGMMGIIFIAFPLLARNLPSPDKVVRREGFSTKILDRNGKLLYDIYAEQKRTPIELDQVPDYLKEATISIEDKNFYEHQGFDLTGWIRAGFNIVIKRKLQGGSTLTQQLVKNVLLTPERTIVRKIREFVIALQIESRYSKDEILQMYLNEVPYGGTAWGVQAAAETYFGKSVEDLNLIESAFLAGLPQRPSVYSPYSATPKAYLDRTKEVLRRMREDNHITREQEEEAKKSLEDLEMLPRGANFKAPHFVQYVQTILEGRYGQRVTEQGGLKVTTTLDLDLQEKAQEIVVEEIEKVEHLDISNGASVAIDPETGEIIAMVGSRGFDDEDIDGQVNVTLSLRQPGSAIKPITYVTALKKGYTASTLLVDVPTEFPGGAGQPPYKPENYDGEYRGPLQVRYTLGNSINVAAVKMLAMVGIKDTLKTAYSLGISSLEPTQETLNRVGLSLTLGGGEVRLLELTSAFSAFLNDGYKVEPIAILKVEDSNGKVLEEHEPKKGKQVLSVEEAFIISDILSDNKARELVFGLNSLLNISGRQVAVKTGTTNDKRDNWTVGGDSQVIIGVWVGNNDNSPMKAVASGVSGASPIWRKILLTALEEKPNIAFKVPDGVVTASVDKFSGFRAHDDFESRTEYFIKGTEPEEDTVHVKLKLCRGEERLATPSQVAAHDYDEKEYYVLKEEDPTAGPGDPNRWQEGILNWINEQSDERYRPPTEYCSGGSSAPINVEFVNPTDRTSDLPNEFTIKFRAEAINEITEMRLEIDGTHIRSFTSPPYQHSVSLTDGVHKLRAIAKDSEDNESDRRVTVGVGVDWDYVEPSPSPSPTP